MIEAGGGVVWQRRDGALHVLLVHRPRYDDWSLPKGKCGRGEAALACALREVHEETGLHCEPGPELAEARYVDHQGRDKRVRYWAMEPLWGDFRPNGEVDEVRWVCLEDAAAALSYGHDVTVVDGLADTLRSAAMDR